MDKQTYRIVLLRFVLVLGSVLFGYLLGINHHSLDLTARRGSQIRDARDNLVRPLLEFNSDEQGGTKDLVKENKELADFISRELKDSPSVSRVAVYLRNLDSGIAIGYKQDDDFLPASLFKLPIAMALYDMSENDENLLERKILYDKVREPGIRENLSGLTSNNIKIGQSYSVEELIEIMLEKSDNQAAAILYEITDKDTLKNVYAYIGIEGEEVESGDTGGLSPKQYSAFLRLLYNATFLDRHNSNKVLAYLVQSDFDKGIEAGVESGVRVANKYGISFSPSGESELHDCGIVYTKSPYLICVMTEGKELPALGDFISKVSAFAYDKYANSSQTP